MEKFNEIAETPIKKIHKHHHVLMAKVEKINSHLLMSEDGNFRVP
jgi:hypothetical protein